MTWTIKLKRGDRAIRMDCEDNDELNLPGGGIVTAKDLKLGTSLNGGWTVVKIDSDVDADNLWAQTIDHFQRNSQDLSGPSN